MSAPLVVNTSDGTCWTRRGALRGGEALYAPEGVCSCPEFVMATLAELAEHGIVGSADVLPVPLGPARQSRSILDHARDALGARMTKDDLRLVLENVTAYAAELERQLAVKDRPVDEDPIVYSLTEAAENLPVEDDVTPQVTKLRSILAGQRAAVEDPHDSPLHHDYRIGRDLPQTGGAR